jgi:RNA polymerase sigma-70 factor (ECF subfamily)
MTGAQQAQHVDRVRAAYEATHARLWRTLLAYSGSREVADDAAAEAFAQALRRGDAITDVAAWVWRAAFNLARGELARRRAAPVDPGEAAESLPAPAVELLHDLQLLPAADRELLVLCHVGGWTPTELARITGTPAATVRVRLHRANRRARTLLSETEEHGS